MLLLKVHKGHLTRSYVHMAIQNTVYDKTFEGENFFADLVQPRMFSREIFPSKFFSDNIASCSSLFLVVQIMVYKEYRE